MPSTSASHVIFFIAAVVVSMAIAGALIGVTHQFSEDIESRGNTMGDNIRTDISIVNDPVAMPYNASNNTLSLYVMNTGSRVVSLSNTSIIVMLNGTYMDNLTFVMKGGASDWKPHTLVTIVVGNVTLSPDDYRVKIVVEGVATDTLEFRIE